MKKLAIVIIVSVFFASPSSSAHGARVPVRVQFGWETTYQHLATVPPADPKGGAGTPEERIELAFVYDQYWIILPFWTSGGSFALYQAVEPPAKPERFMVLNDQDPEKLSKMLGVPQDRFTKPFFYRVPFGWVVVVGSVVGVSLMSGRSPEKRFARLWGDPRFRTAVARLLGLEGQDLPAEFDTLILTGPPPESDARFVDEVRNLQDQGVGRKKAVRDLEFLLRYLVDNGKLAMAEPPPASEPAGNSPPP
jgi:hypothetical protein